MKLGQSVTKVKVVITEVGKGGSSRPVSITFDSTTVAEVRDTLTPLIAGHFQVDPKLIKWEEQKERNRTATTSPKPKKKG